MSININIISGFLGAGKTTFLKKIIPNLGGKIALIENEFGSMGIDGDLIDNKLPIKEIYAGCICCSLVKDFKKAIEELSIEYKPDYILIEPSGVGNLSDIIKVCKKISENSNFNIKINRLITIVDISSFEDYIEGFGEFYLDQIKNAHIIFLSHFDKIDDIKVQEVISKIKLYNKSAFIMNEDWHSYSGEKIVDILSSIDIEEVESNEETTSIPANKVFSTLSVSKPRVFRVEEIDSVLASLGSKEYGFIFRAKGILKLDTNRVISFDFTPHHFDWRYLDEDKETKVAIIGSELNSEKILECFNKSTGGIQWLK
ncbi:CobW family GTP-binding protein [Clostridium cylindrosporum]|uniref:CobW/P47K family protein n=1 Tax=Clostridium cylindrosporum DSM 605 TaxID=1121307 RepID=A0A0J8D9R8_CLOCY|nr:GTP-binding protein [Clostridium cylindrosporum]KMT21033.1 CobW/P47K family protein [Clostridium cylindrosporum DSM 605]